jgi:hypothetical protein
MKTNKEVMEEFECVQTKWHLEKCEKCNLKEPMEWESDEWKRDWNKLLFSLQGDTKENWITKTQDFISSQINKVKHDCDILVNTILDTKNKEIKQAEERGIEKYNELIYAVGNKYPNETRHETALRYIKQAEIDSTSLSSKINQNNEKTRRTYL